MDALFDSEFRNRVLLTKIHQPSALKPWRDTLNFMADHAMNSLRSDHLTDGWNTVLDFSRQATQCANYIDAIMCDCE